jgi:hypothetical protein
VYCELLRKGTVQELTVNDIFIEVLRLIVNAPWYVPNSVIRKDLRIPAKEEISLRAHPNDLITTLNEPSLHKHLRLRLRLR